MTKGDYHSPSARRPHRVLLDGLRLASILAMTVYSTALFAQSSSTESAREILAANLMAVGGKEGIANIGTLTATAAVSGPRGDFTTTVTSSTNGDVRATWHYPDKVVDMGISRGHIWYTDPETKKVQDAPENYEFFIRGHEFHFDALFIAKRYRGFVVTKDVPFRSCTCTSIRMTDKMHNTALVYFDPETHRVRGFRKFRTDGDKEVTMDFVYDDWKPVDGIELPWKVTIYDGDDVYTYKFLKISINTAEHSDFLPETADGVDKG